MTREKNTVTDAPLASFGAQTASFVSQVLSADWSCFYQVD